LLESLWHAKSLDGLEILAPAILNGNTKSWLGTVNYWTEFGEFSPHEKPRANAFVPGACLFFAKSIVTRWGGFPEIHRIEDLLGIHHWIKSGARTRFLPNLGVFHVCTGQLKESIVLQWNLGMWSARARKLSQLSDSFLVRAFWLWPFLGGLRFMRVSRRWLRNPDWSMRARYLALLPLTVGSLSIWNAAFIYGSLTSYEG
jgi:hypothetical protein